MRSRAIKDFKMGFYKQVLAVTKMPPYSQSSLTIEG